MSEINGLRERIGFLMWNDNMTIKRKTDGFEVCIDDTRFNVIISKVVV